MKATMVLFACLTLVFASTIAMAFEDNFNDGNYNGWEVNAGDQGTWSVVDGKLRVTAGPQYTRILVGDPSWTDYTYEVTATRVTGNYPCILFRAQDFETCYDFEGSYGSMTMAIFKGTGDLWGGTEVTPGNRPAFTEGDTHTYKVTVSGANIKSYLDGNMVMDFDDTDAIMAGRVGLASYSTAVIDYDDVSVTLAGTTAVEPGDKLTTTWGSLRLGY